MPSFDISRHTLRIAQEMGLSYDSSLMADEDCHELLLDGEPSGLVELPVEWVRDDGAYFWVERFQSLRPYTPPADVFDIFRRELEAAHCEGGVFQLTMHPHVIGYRSRIWILEEIIRHAQALGNVWFATHGEITTWARDHAG
jgi:peptidoglycan/xylan/chitin deacetylase (PgdA/CDA1 family)